MEKVIITLDELENAAFDDYQGELARILSEVGFRIEQGEQPRKLMDINGNKVGSVEYE